jgi:hypothetical protein
MSDDAGRTFLSRWSRRKIEARAAEQAPPPPAKTEVPIPSTAADPAVAEGTGEVAERPVELPDPETLHGLESDYRDFLRPEVDESLRRTALKRLFADPHFNVMDGLDIYIDDYSKPDPISPALLRSMNQARGLNLFSDEEAVPDAAALQHDQDGGVDPTPGAHTPAETIASTHCPSETEAPPAVADVPAPPPKNG